MELIVSDQSQSKILDARILIVDDQDDTRELLSAILQSGGYSRVFTCSDASKVVELHRKNQYDLILLDLQMPGMNGFDVMDQLRAENKQGYLPVIVITGQVDSKLNSLKAGARDFVVKPYDVEEMLLRVHNTLEMRLAHTHALNTSQRMQTLALQDPLTNLANRRLVEDRLDVVLRQAKRENSQAAVMYLDLDGFKKVNDNLGHHAGDVLLQQVAERLKAAVRADDTVGRLGGDEFVVLLRKVASVDDACRVAAKIIESVARPYNLEGQPARVTTSVGIAIYPLHSDSPDQLMQKADAALYQAKESGKNAYRLAKAAPVTEAPPPENPPAPEPAPRPEVGMRAIHSRPAQDNVAELHRQERAAQAPAGDAQPRFRLFKGLRAGT